ncbi:MAG TPA: transcriptional regulator, partial [Rhodobiaceae bacterium]|nr:transcriptional regulator [Rhodobiaceae bacterium]
EGIQLNSAFFSISDPKLRRRLLELIRVLGGQDDEPATAEISPKQ